MRDEGIILLGDFNAITTQLRTVFYDTSQEMLRELDNGDLGLTRISQDKKRIEYERFLVDMSTAHGLANLNGLHRFPEAGGYTCFPHRHGASTVEYVLAQPSLIPYIKDLVVGPKPFGLVVDHAFLTFSISFRLEPASLAQALKHARYIFT